MPRTPNEQRAEKAYRAVLSYESESSIEECISDLLGDLRHLCDESGYDYAERDGVGYRNYLSELGEQRNEDDGEGVHADLGVSPFRTVDVGHVPLHRLADGEIFEDAAMKRWRKRHAGPTQSGVRVETLDGKLWEDYDLSTRVHQLDHEHSPISGSRNRLTADTVEYQCDSCGVFYGVAE